QLIEQSLCLLQVQGIEPFGEPVVDRCKKIASLVPLALFAPQPRQAHRRPQFPGLGLLSSRYSKRALEIVLRSRKVRLRRLQRNLARNAIDLRLVPCFLAYLHCPRRFVDAAPSFIEL